MNLLELVLRLQDRYSRPSYADYLCNVSATMYREEVLDYAESQWLTTAIQHRISGCNTLEEFLELPIPGSAETRRERRTQFLADWVNELKEKA